MRGRQQCVPQGRIGNTDGCFSISVTVVSDSNADEMPFGGLSTHAMEPTSSLSLVSSGYGTAASSEKSRWSQAEVPSVLSDNLFTYLFIDTRTVLNFLLCMLLVICLSGYRVTQKVPQTDRCAMWASAQHVATFLHAVVCPHQYLCPVFFALYSVHFPTNI